MQLKTKRYSGKEKDATGLYYYGARYFDPTLMRWLSPDPIGPVDGPNIYLFLNGNPVNSVDVNGNNGELTPYLLATLVIFVTLLFTVRQQKRANNKNPVYYMMSPHDDPHIFLDNAAGHIMARIDVIPVFKDVAQFQDFTREAADRWNYHDDNIIDQHRLIMPILNRLSNAQPLLNMNAPGQDQRKYRVMVHPPTKL